MKAFISNLGYNYTTNNDLTNKQFRFISANIDIDEETSCMGNVRDLITCEYQLSLNNYDVSLFHSKLDALYNATQNMTSKQALNSDFDNGKSYYLSTYSVTPEKNEDSTLLTLQFIIREF